MSFYGRNWSNATDISTTDSYFEGLFAGFVGGLVYNYIVLCPWEVLVRERVKCTLLTVSELLQ